MATHTIFLVLLEDSSDHMFSVTAPDNTSVAEWKKLVYAEKRNRLRGYDAADLIIWKLKNPIRGEDVDARMTALGQNLSQIAVRMLPTNMLLDYFPSLPTEGSLHVIMQLRDLPSAGEKRRRLPDQAQAPHSKKPRAHTGPSLPVAMLHSFHARRNVTVNALYQRLNKYHFVMVRGTPASGKSTLAQLLAEHIRTQEPAVDPILISSWPRETPDWHARLTEKYDPDGPNIIILDRARTTYWDTVFWNSFLKPITPQSPDRVILFTGIGIPKGGVSVEGTSMFIGDCKRVGLRPVDHGDGITPAGLFLMADEFTDMVEKLHPADRFTTDFLDYVLRLTAGHSGAVWDFLSIVTADNSYHRLKDDAGEYSLELFQSQFPITELWSRLESLAIFRRGLPMLGELDQPPVARVFRQVLSNNNVTKQMLDLKEDQDALDQCFNWGWLHATTDHDETLCYIFTTPLHQWFVEYYLGTQLSDPTLIMDHDLPTFAIEMIRRFSPQQLSSSRKIGASDKQRRPEARFQDEFYRCCHQYSNGSLISFPDFEDATGKVDLYIPLKKWGVGLLRDGEGLENHSSRFTGPGAYAKMEFEEYIILDFRTERLQEEHLGIPNLYHVIITNNYKHVQIRRGSSMEDVTEFELSSY